MIYFFSEVYLVTVLWRGCEDASMSDNWDDVKTGVDWDEFEADDTKVGNLLTWPVMSIQTLR